jgi:ATP-dependent Lon protease
MIKAYSLSVIETMKESLRLGSFDKEQLELLLQTIDVKSPYQIADLGACLTTADPAKLQKVLEEPDITERLRLTLELLKADLETTRVSRRIHKQIEENVSKSQRRYFLTEQLKQIKRELGMERDEKETLISKFRARIVDKTVPEQASALIEEAIEKLDSLEPASSEFSVTRNHLEWLTETPWGVYSDDSLDISRAETVLDEMHHGLKDVKERILEFIAVSSLRGNVQGKILLLSGPPGVGKTSIAKSIAKALDRQFYRFSVGGMGDVAEIKGHRRTYVGAMPGKFVQALKTTKTSNPVICLDELDKTGRGWAGDPSSALLEALDPEQNSSFVDHYLDTPLDLSKVLFICTANSLETIPGPLLDRMQNIALSGYILEEKVAIALRYLVPTAREEAGLTTNDIVVEDSAVERLARDYCREAGVRNLKNHVEKVLRKVALQIAKRREAGDKAETSSVNDGPAVINACTLESYVGKPVFSPERLYEEPPPGVCMGLAWTSMGGATLYIETVRIAEKGSVEQERKGSRIKVTGSLGDVMKESSDIAWSYVRNLVDRIDPANRFFDSAFIHVHVPSGATPKDGPSAGCAMVTSMMSLALGIPVRSNLAMTGEVTLTGKVLPVGGIREKTIAAKRSGVEHIILPEGNKKDWEELPDHVREGLEVHFAQQFDEHVMPVCFPDRFDAAIVAPSSPAVAA